MTRSVVRIDSPPNVGAVKNQIFEYLDEQKFIKSLGEEPEDVAQTEKYFERFVLRNQENFARKSTAHILFRENGLEIFKNSYFLFFKVMKVLILLFFVLSLIATAMIIINAGNGETSQPHPGQPEPHVFTNLTLGNLFDDEKTRNERMGAAFRDVIKQLRDEAREEAEEEGEWAESESEPRPEESTGDAGSGNENTVEAALEDEEGDSVNIPLSAKEQKLFGVYKLLKGLDIAICLVFFVSLVVLFFYIDNIRVPQSKAETPAPNGGPGSVNSEGPLTSKSSSCPHPPKNFSFFRDLKTSIKNFSLEIDIREPWNFEETNKKHFIYSNPQFWNTSDGSSNKKKKSIHAKCFKDLLRHSRCADDFRDFFKNNLDVTVKSLRILFDFRGTLEHFSKAAKCLKRRERFKQLLKK